MTSRATSPLDRDAFACPQCSQPLPNDARSCPHCGVDLALLALLAERAYQEGLPEATPLATTPEALVPKIGEFLLEQGLISPVQLDVALKRQKELASQSEHRLLGQTMVQLGFIDRSTLDRAINHQIIELHAALQESNRNLERRVAERTAELRRALERLTELNQIKANLISNVSHELRTPLAHIKGYVELLADAQLGPLSDEQSNALSVVHRATDRLGRLIEDLIEFSTASREGLALKLQPVLLQELVGDVLERSREKAGTAEIQLAIEVQESLPPVQADPERLGWVLYQLVDNGIKFTPAGGRVTVRAQKNGDLVSTSVIDTGIGIPSSRLEEIFEPFHQLDASATRRYGGTGLGLSLVQLILNTHGSQVNVSSEEGEGTTFSFALPCSTEDR